VLFVNRASGGGKADRAHLAERARERGIEPVVLAPGADLRGLAERAAADGADVLGMAGGDGSLGVVASVARDRQLPFACVPAGTRNHFARDLGLAPDDLLGALDAFGEALEGRIDLGEVNVQTARAVLGPSAELPGVRVVDDLGVVHSDPGVVLVSNNPYALDRAGTPGGRPALDSGRLGILVLYRPGDPRHGPGRGWTARSLRVTADQDVAAGVDGEAVRLTPPLDFTIVPRALRVRRSVEGFRHPGAPASGPAG
jgi:hypothetical protein